MMEENGFDSISFLYNNCFEVDNIAIAGSRGWFFDDTADKKIVLREAGRIETSIKAAIETGKEPVLFLHYPPLNKEAVCEDIMSVIKKYDVKNIYYGHVHSAGALKAFEGEYEGMNFKCISCDLMDFKPLLIKT